MTTDELRALLRLHFGLSCTAQANMDQGTDECFERALNWYNPAIIWLENFICLGHAGLLLDDEDRPAEGEVTVPKPINLGFWSGMSDAQDL